MNADAHESLATVVIPTFNRAKLLGETLDILAARANVSFRWDVVVVDNNSSDDTRSVVESRIKNFPVPLRYLFERAQGRSHALNAGIAATTAPILVFTDDDVAVGETWLESSATAFTDGAIEYSGGPVRPIWEAERPKWLSMDRSDLWGTLAILDYGPEPFVFEDRKRVPLGANMAVRRTLFERIGLFDGRLGRSGGTQLLGQEVPEFLARARAAGARGMYIPTMVVDHHVPARRLTKQYFRRWWYGKGLSRAQLDRLQPVTELGLDLSTVRHLAGVPLFMFRTAINDAVGWITDAFDAAEQFRREMMLCYFAGYVAARRRR